MTETDEAWKSYHRESWNDVKQRVDQFLAWLVQQPQTNVVVVSHGVWIETLLRTYAATVLGDERRVYNTDALACHCVSSNRGEFLRLRTVQQICKGGAVHG